jgi:hypothetical protein
MPTETVHCSLCRKAIKGASFKERMKKLRHHRKAKHPEAHKKSVQKTRKTKRTHDPLRKRGLQSKPEVLSVKDIKCPGLVRILFRKDRSRFPEFALYPKRFDVVEPMLVAAGFEKMSRGKYVLRTNMLSVFVYHGGRPP